MVLGAILGPVAENAFLTSMISYQDDWTVFFTRPVSGVVLVLALIALLFPLYGRWRRQRATPVAATSP
jgi:putative tricarboxylic transport membrane protein